MRSLWFIVPVHQRLGLATVCLKQLRRTCDALYENGIEATAVVISDYQSLRDLGVIEMGFATIIRDNEFLSRRFNDGIQLATDPNYNPGPADFVVPCGSDDWVDHRLFLEPLPEPDTIQGFQYMCFVNELGTEISTRFLDYQGGAGIRIIPRQLVAPLGYRPADEDRERGCDTSILRNLKRHHGDHLKVKHFLAPPEWIVDWKTKGAQLNSYHQIANLHQGEVRRNPFEVLAGFYPDEALEEMEAHYFGARVPA